MIARAFIMTGAMMLFGTAPARPTAGVAVPGLNHAYIVLDQATFDAIRQSPVVDRILGPNDSGLPDHAPSTANADRFFLRGRQTYLELFAPSNRFDEPVGKVGIGIGADDTAQFRTIETGWQRACGAGLARQTVHWRKERPPVPWYESLSCAVTASGNELVLWAMLYRPEFRNWQSGNRPAGAQVTRRALLAPRAKAGQGRFDVTGLTMNVSPDVFARLAPQLDAAGLRRKPVANGARWTGGDWFLTLHRDTGGPALRSIRLTAYGVRPETGLRTTLGNAVLSRSGGNRFELGRIDIHWQLRISSFPRRRESIDADVLAGCATSVRMDSRLRGSDDRGRSGRSASSELNVDRP